MTANRNGDIMKYSTQAANPFALIDDVSNFQYINSVCITQFGTFLLSATSRTGYVPEDLHSNETVSFLSYTRRSTDRCRTWQPRVIAYDGSDMGPEWNSEMGQFLPVPAPLGPERKMRIYQFHIRRHAPKSVRFGKIVFTYSEDDGKSWLGPDGPGTVFEVQDPAGYTVSESKDGWGWHLMAPGHIMSNGEWILPINVSSDPAPLGEIQSEVVFMISKNILTEPDPEKIEFEFFPKPPRGILSPIEGERQRSLAQEPQVVELSDHRLMCVFRTGNGRIEYTVSKDYGRTWTNADILRYWPEDGPVVLNPNCACPFTRLTDGRYALLHCNNDGTHNGGRDPYDSRKNRNPVYVSVGREVKGGGQPMMFAAPRLLCSIEGFHPENPRRDLTYGAFIESCGEYFHFYNAVWNFIQVNKADPLLLDFVL
jgi:hypothetical protein